MFFSASERTLPPVSEQGDEMDCSRADAAQGTVCYNLHVMASTQTRCDLFIDGAERKPRSGAYSVRENPATEEPLAEVARGGPEDIDAAVRAAERAFAAWSRLPASERAGYLLRIADALSADGDRIALLNTRETGKPIRESAAVEIGGSARTLRYYSGAHTRLNGETLQVNENQISLTVKEPVGVAAHIIPWNFPLLLSFWKIAPALVAGCTIVLKPAELTSCAIVEVAKLCSEAGLPDGVLNVVPGEGAVAGQALAEHPGISKVAFTGSTEVGRTVMRTAAGGIKRVSLELGGKAPCVVFPDADIEAAVEACLRGGFFNQGENCTAVTRLLLHEKIYDSFLSAYLDRISKIRIGDPEDPETEFGAVISREHYESVLGYIEKGVSQGARVIAGGGRPEGFARGHYVAPTVMEKVEPGSVLAREEIFGPVVCVMPFGTEEQAVAMANDVEYGLAGGIWTRDMNRALRVAKAVKAGYLWVNTYGGIIPETPYGGFGQSGIGKELGSAGIDAYLETKCVNIFTGDAAGKWYRG